MSYAGLGMARGGGGGGGMHFAGGGARMASGLRSAGVHFAGSPARASSSMRGPGVRFAGGAARLATGPHGGGVNRRWHGGGGRRRGGGWGGWGGGWGYPVPVYGTVLAYDPCEECWNLPPYTRARDLCVIENGCRTPLLGMGQTPTSAQDVVNRTTGLIAGTIAGGVIGLGVGVLALGGIAYYMFVGRHRRVRRNRRRSR